MKNFVEEFCRSDGNSFRIFWFVTTRIYKYPAVNWKIHENDTAICNLIPFQLTLLSRILCQKSPPKISLERAEDFFNLGWVTRPTHSKHEL